MILIDTSAWIHFFRDPDLQQSSLIRKVLREEKVVMGDLILVEVLQGLKTPTQARQVAVAFAGLRNVILCGPEIAPLAAENYRTLRRAGVTVRSTIDVIIATWCMENEALLIHSDRDFNPMRDRLGLAVYPD